MPSASLARASSLSCSFSALSNSHVLIFDPVRGRNGMRHDFRTKNESAPSQPPIGSFFASYVPPSGFAMKHTWRLATAVFCIWSKSGSSRCSARDGLLVSGVRCEFVGRCRVVLHMRWYQLVPSAKSCTLTKTRATTSLLIDQRRYNCAPRRGFSHWTCNHMSKRVLLTLASSLLVHLTLGC